MRLLLILSSIFLLQSCASYQYLTVESTDITSEENIYFYETEDYKIEYRFNGRNIPVHLTFHNKSTQPIYIDWFKSALIVNGQQFPYSASTQNNSRIVVETHQIDNYGYEERTTSSVSHNITFIPPNSTESRLLTYLIKPFNSPVNVSKIQRYSNEEYQKYNTPLAFRNYLTLYKDEKHEVSEIIDHSFFLRRTEYGKTPPGSRGLYYNESYIVNNNSDDGSLIFATLMITGGFLVLLLIL